MILLNYKQCVSVLPFAHLAMPKVKAWQNDLVPLSSYFSFDSIPFRTLRSLPYTRLLSPLPSLWYKDLTAKNVGRKIIIPEPEF